jgi:hypothetical protein
MERFQPILAWGWRTLLGALLGLALGMTGLGLGWILFVFFGATSHTALLTLMMGGASAGAASGAFLAWLRLDNNTLPLLLGTAALLLLAAATGAWGGFQFGADQEVPCCAEPEIGPMTYTVLGAVVASNGVALLLGIIQTLRREGFYRRPARPGLFRS